MICESKKKFQKKYLPNDPPNKFPHLTALSLPLSTSSGTPPSPPPLTAPAIQPSNPLAKDRRDWVKELGTALRTCAKEKSDKVSK